MVQCSNTLFGWEIPLCSGRKKQLQSSNSRPVDESYSWQACLSTRHKDKPLPDTPWMLLWLLQSTTNVGYHANHLFSAEAPDLSFVASLPEGADESFAVFLSVAAILGKEQSASLTQRSSRPKASKYLPTLLRASVMWKLGGFRHLER